MIELYANYSTTAFKVNLVYVSRSYSVMIKEVISKQVKYQLSAKFRLLAMTYTNRQPLFIATGIDTVRHISRTTDEQLLAL